MEQSIIQGARAAVQEMSQRVAEGAGDALAKAHDTLSPHSEVNVGNTERVISAIVGSALISGGIARHSLFGIMLAVGGGGLIYRALTGHCPINERLGRNTAGMPRSLSAWSQSADTATTTRFPGVTLPSSPEASEGMAWRDGRRN